MPSVEVRNKKTRIQEAFRTEQTLNNKQLLEQNRH